MITKLLSTLKKVTPILTLLYTLVLMVLSLINLKKLPSQLPSFNDKLVHSLAYFLLAIAWFCFFYLNKTYKKPKAILYSASIAFVFGALIEVLQGTLTKVRAFDVYDLIANTLGIVIAVLLIMVIKTEALKK